MAITPGYGGALTLNFQTTGAATYLAKNVSFSHSRSSLDSTSLADFAPIRVQRFTPSPDTSPAPPARMTVPDLVCGQ